MLSKNEQTCSHGPGNKIHFQFFISIIVIKRRLILHNFERFIFFYNMSEFFLNIWFIEFSEEIEEEFVQNNNVNDLLLSETLKTRVTHRADFQPPSYLRSSSVILKEFIENWIFTFDFCIWNWCLTKNRI